MGALNYIESDVEVSRHVLGNAQTGFSASKLITLPNGEPSPDEKRNIERRFTDRFSGSDGKKFILSIALSELHNEARAHLVCLLVEYDVFVGTDLCIGQGEGLVGFFLICQLEEVNEATLCVKCEWRLL